jgi:hypothetical protein
MRFYSVALLTGATAVAAGNTANLLLPGFQGKDLQAGIIGTVCTPWCVRILRCLRTIH